MPNAETHAPALAETARLAVLLDFCRTVVRSDEESLQLAMRQYQQALAANGRRP